MRTFARSVIRIKQYELRGLVYNYLVRNTASQLCVTPTSLTDFLKR